MRILRAKCEVQGEEIATKKVGKKKIIHKLELFN
jgi:hypothetical protein